MPYYGHIMEAFKEAYKELFKSVYCTVPRSAIEMYAKRRAVEEYNHRLTVYGCVNFMTAKETLWLVEIAQLLCTGELGTEPAIKLLEMTLASLKQDMHD
jgi:hypothetical protein